MAIFRTPYPGFSWSLSQHMNRAVSEPILLFEMLKAAYLYGNTANSDQLITQHLLSYLPPNIREDAGKPQIWRDYQQVLADLGLIVSTRFTEKIIVTPIGMMWLDGSIGYSEMLTTQSLAFQYPNGQKQDISTRLANLLLENSIARPNTRTELDLLFGIRMKPAVLLLRLLLTLQSEPSTTAYISDKECADVLVGIANNTDWQVALSRLLNARESQIPLEIDKAVLRHIQEWYAWLNATDFFETERTRKGWHLKLSSIALNNIESVQILCQHHEQEETFWLPDEYSAAFLGMSWFSRYGNPDIDSQWYSADYGEDYITNNYIDGIEDEASQPPAIFDPSLRQWREGINLQPYQFEKQSEIKITQYLPQKIDTESIEQSHKKRQENTRLHENIVRLLAQKLESQGFSVMEDKQSVDLLAIRDEIQAIFEIKTVNNKNLPVRMRLGIGQLLEYRYRRSLQTQYSPISILVISSMASLPSWMFGYLQQEVKMGLVGLKNSQQFHPYTGGILENILSS
jgi:hypothetical protein